MRSIRAARILRRVLGIGLSWVLVWVVFGALLGALQIPDPEVVAPGEFVRRLVLKGLLPGIAFGVALAIAGRGRKVSELSLVRSLACAFLTCALVQIPLYLVQRDLGLGLGTIVWLALGGCVFGQFVTIVWHAAVRGGARIRAARHFEPLMVSQALIDFAVVLLACWLAFPTSPWEYPGTILLTAAVTVGCFSCCGMYPYRPIKIRVSREQIVAIALSTAISFLAVFVLLVMLAVREDGRTEGIGHLNKLMFSSPLSIPMKAFAYVFVLTVASRLAWVSVIQHMPSRRPRPR